MPLSAPSRPDRAGSSPVWPILVALLVIAGHNHLLWRTDHPIDGEAVSFTIPQAEFFFISLAKGEAPWFNPFESGGTSPLLDPPSLGPLHPAYLLLAALDPAWAINMIYLISLVLAGLGLFLLARSLALARPAAALAAVVYTLSAFPAGAINAGALSWTAAFTLLPWLLWLGEREPGRRPFNLLLGGVCVALVLLGSHPELALLALGAAAAYTLARTAARVGGERQSWRPLGRLLGAAILGLGLAALHLAPLLFCAGSRETSPTAMPGPVTLLVPDLGTSVAGTVQVGLIALHLGVGGLLLGHWRRCLPPLVLIAFGLLLPSTIGGLALTLGLALLASVGLQSILETRDRRPARLLTYLGISGLLTIQGLAMSNRLRELPVLRAALEPSSIPVWLVAAPILAAAAVLLARRGLIRGQALGLLMMMMAATELVSYQQLAQPAQGRPFEIERHFDSAGASRVFNTDRDRFRVALLDTGLPEPDRPIHKGQGSVLGFATANLRSQASPECLARLSDRMLGISLDQAVLTKARPQRPNARSRFDELRLDEGGPNDRILDLLDVKYVVSDLEVEGEAFHAIGRYGPLTVWTNRERPRRFRRIARYHVVPDRDEALDAALDPAFDPDNEVILERPPATAAGAQALNRVVRVLAHRYSDIELQLDGSVGELLVISETLQPGWYAEIDGSPVELLRANACFFAIHVPPGDHRVRLGFRPPYAILGGLISLGTLLAGALWLVRARRT